MGKTEPINFTGSNDIIIYSKSPVYATKLASKSELKNLNKVNSLTTLVELAKTPKKQKQSHEGIHNRGLTFLRAGRATKRRSFLYRRRVEKQ